MPTEMIIDGDKRKSAYEIAVFLLGKNKLKNATEQNKCRLMECLIEENEKDYLFAPGRKIKIPDGKKEIMKLITVPINIKKKRNDKNKNNGGITSPPNGWMLTRSGYLVQGVSGWLVDENGLYILKDGRRLDDNHMTSTEKEQLCIGKKNFIWKGLDEILKNNIVSSTMRKEKYSTRYLLYEYGQNMDEVVYQAFQINICYENPNNPTNKTTTWQPYTHKNFNHNFYVKSIGDDENDIPIVVTRIGIESAINKLVIAGPHGDERNAQRLIMSTQKYFSKKGSPVDTVLYFIPCLSPTMAFADARGIPVVDKQGKKVDIQDVLNTITIPNLHDLIAEQIPRSLEGKKDKKVLLRSLIQGIREDEKEIQTNGIAFDNYDNFNKYYYGNEKEKGNEGYINKEYPRYGIDANRDIRKSLPSTNSFFDFIKGIKKGPDSKNIKVIMMHGYIPGGAVYGTYEVIPSGVNGDINKKAKLDTEGEYFAKAFWKLLFSSTIDSFYKDTEKNPLIYAGEWNQILYLELGGILSVDIELPKETFDEGRRGDTPPENYDHKKVKDKFINGVLATKKKDFYLLLNTYIEEIQEYKKNNPKDVKR